MWYIVEETTTNSGIEHDIVAARVSQEDAIKLAAVLNVCQPSTDKLHVEFAVWSEDAWLTSETLWIANIIKAN